MDRSFISFEPHAPYFCDQTDQEKNQQSQRCGAESGVLQRRKHQMHCTAPISPPFVLTPDGNWVGCGIRLRSLRADYSHRALQVGSPAVILSNSVMQRLRTINDIKTPSYGQEIN